jgi:hypothetical protein
LAQIAKEGWVEKGLEVGKKGGVDAEDGVHGAKERKPRDKRVEVEWVVGWCALRESALEGGDRVCTKGRACPIVLRERDAHTRMMKEPCADGREPRALDVKMGEGKGLTSCLLFKKSQ